MSKAMLGTGCLLSLLQESPIKIKPNRIKKRIFTALNRR
jgi:hypothetical protein